MGLNTGSAPEFSEQILLHKLRNELSGSFDLSKQSAFEIALQKTREFRREKLLSSAKMYTGGTRGISADKFIFI